MEKDWVGNRTAIFTTMGAKGHALDDREIDDYYATDPLAIKELMKLENLNHYIWEPCCGEGHLCKPLVEAGYDVLASDLIDRGYGLGGIDFLEENFLFTGDIITNPPYSKALEFVKHALELIEDGNKVCMFLKTTFLEGKGRKPFFMENPPKTIYAKNGDFNLYPSSAVSYCWFVWEKGFKGDPIIKWFN